MRFYRYILFLILVYAASLFVNAQNIERFNCFSYSVNEGLLQTTISQMAFDKNNNCWISFPNGIQKFDGKHFTNVPVQPGLPDDKLVHLFQCKNGDLLLSHSQGISKYNISNNKFTQVYNKPATIESQLVFIGEDDGFIYLYNEKAEIIAISNNDYKIKQSTQTGLPNVSFGSLNKPVISTNIINHKVALQIKGRLYLWDLQNKKLIGQSDSIAKLATFFLRLKNDSVAYYLTDKTAKGLLTWNFQTGKQGLQIIKGMPEDLVYRCIILPWQNKNYISFTNRLFETDDDLLELKAEIVNFQNKPFIEPITGFGNIYKDNFENLFLQTVTGGIKKVIRNNYPIKYYGTEKKEQNNVLTILPDKINNRILIGSVSNGIMVFDTLQHLVKQIKNLPGRSNSFSPNSIIKDNEGNYIVLAGGESNAWRFSSDLSAISPVKILWKAEEGGVNYFGNFLFQDSKQAIVQTQSWICKTNLKNGVAEGYKVTNSYTMGGLWYKNSIITHANDELIFIDATTFKQIKTIPFKNTGYVRCFVVDKSGSIYVGSNKGIFKIDETGKILLHLTKENGLPDECIYAMVFDGDGFLWCSTNKGIFKLNKDNSITLLTKEDGLQENEFNTNVVAKADDGEIFFGGVNGVSSFYPNNISHFEENINLLVTQIKVNNEEVFKDTAVWNVDKIELPYDENSLSFDFIAIANNNPGQYIYQYRMESIDKQWIQNTDMQTVRYFLPPGKYVFKMYAGRSFNKDAKAMKEIVIIINPPYWKTWWFISAIILFAIGGLAFSFNRYNKIKYQKKLDVLANEHRMQMERERISRDLHDSIGAYANAVLYNTELLQKENNADEKNALMNDLKFASKDIITSLRETVWALKKDTYTAEECLLRIKNFIQALSRYYPNIQFKTEGEASAEKILHHTRALHVVRIVQEAVTNAIKHAQANNISLSSNDNKDEWELMVVDDGKGFDYEAMKNTGEGNGLINMNQRAAESGIQCIINSTPGSGTKMRLVI